MTDLRKAAEAVLEAWDWDWSEPRNKALRERMEALRQALAQPEREQYVTRVVAMHEDGTYTTERIPLPKREWVGLTDEERQEIVKQEVHWFGICRVIEAKLKEKNGG